ncbi:MAG: chemotaxis protein CheW [Magnetococcales bacterium]|nr:chemotaxis protein CheW [Magnetococcales bacterium]
MTDENSETPGSDAIDTGSTMMQMEGFPCLIFRLLDKLYGIDTQCVREIVRLPEVTPVESAPRHVVGVINLRGRVIPIIDLNLRLGRRPERYRLSDAILVIEVSEHLFGVIISEVREVRFLGDTDIDPTPILTEQENGNSIGRDVARVDDEMVLIIHQDRLLLSGIPDALHDIDEEESADSLSERRLFNPEASDEERTIFQERAKRLLSILDSHELSGLVSLAIVQLQDELLGVMLDRVRGFTQVREMTPIPCTPQHIVGNINQRGDILTLVDITGTLDIPSLSNRKPDKAMVVNLEEMTVGLMIHNVLDVIHILPEQIVKSPIASSALKREHTQGALPYGDRMLSVLNLEQILQGETLEVDERI